MKEKKHKNVFKRVLKHLGCPHGCCTDAHRGPAAEFLRTQCQNIMKKLLRASSKQFNGYLRDYVRYQPLHDLLDFLHAYVGFCIDPSSLLSPLSKYFIQDHLHSNITHTSLYFSKISTCGYAFYEKN